MPAEQQDHNSSRMDKVDVIANEIRLLPEGKSGQLLLADAQLLDQGTIAVDILVFDIIQQTATPADQHQQTTARVVILLVDL